MESELINEIPGLREAIASEQHDRSAAFLALTETVCGVELRPITLLDLMRLTAIGSPFVLGGRVSAADVLSFYKLQQAGPSRVARWFNLRMMAATTDTETAALAAMAYVKEAMADAPPGRAENGEPEYWTFAHSLLHVFGSHYGWPPEVILNMPMKASLPLLNLIRRENDPSAPLFNPQSDRVRSERLRELNSRRN